MSKKDEVISFRLPSEKYEEYKPLIDKSNSTKSSFFRNLVMNNNCTIVLKEKQPKDYRKLLFITNKASNNLNQIAKILNTHAKLGILDGSKLPLIFNMLIDIDNLLKGNINE